MSMKIELTKYVELKTYTAEKLHLLCYHEYLILAWEFGFRQLFEIMITDKLLQGEDEIAAQFSCDKSHGDIKAVGPEEPYDYVIQEGVHL